jgi:RNA polymerase sigma factor (sigma-70 family)
METARNKLAGQFVREPSAEEVAKELKIPLEIYYRLDQQVNDAILVSLEDLSSAADPDWEKTQEKYAGNSFFDPLSLVESKDLVEKLSVAIKALPKREQLVVSLYYWEEMTLREIGQILNLSEGRVCQIAGQAVGRLRVALGVKPRESRARKSAQDSRKVPDSFFSLARDVGSQVQNAQAGLDLRQALLTQTPSRRECVSVGSVDEDMTKLIPFQRAFEKSALFIGNSDEIPGTLIELMR